MGLGAPEMLALGAAMASPDSLMSSRAVLFAGIRTATVESPAVVSSGTSLDFGRISVRGPGQKVSISIRAFSGTELTMRSNWVKSEI